MSTKNIEFDNEMKELAQGKIISEAQAKQQVQAGNLIYINPYVRSDGTEVKGYYRKK